MKTDFPNLNRYASENTKLLALPNDGNRIVFFGDSITEFWTARNSTLFQNPNHINRGISGQTTSQMVVRFSHDVIDLQPQRVVILAGINDIAENNGPITVEEILQNIITMIELALANKIKVILCTVLPCNTITWRNHIAPADSIIQLNQMLFLYAKKQAIPFVDYYTPMVNKSKGLDIIYSDDGLHPNTEGYKVMEVIISQYLH